VRGWLAGTNAARFVLGKAPDRIALPVTFTMMGHCLNLFSSASPKHFQPMPPNFASYRHCQPKCSSKIRALSDKISASVL
jgi:methylenetetrahydrofolate--tRNA-(uracil-5-)-methyltransferase